MPLGCPGTWKSKCSLSFQGLLQCARVQFYILHELATLVYATASKCLNFEEEFELLCPAKWFLSSKFLFGSLMTMALFPVMSMWSSVPFCQSLVFLLLYLCVGSPAFSNMWFQYRIGPWELTRGTKKYVETVSCFCGAWGSKVYFLGMHSCAKWIFYFEDIFYKLLWTERVSDMCTFGSVIPLSIVHCFMFSYFLRAAA